MKTTSITPLTPQTSKLLVDSVLTPILKRQVERSLVINQQYGALWQAIDNLYNAGGKRLRSYMTLMTYRAFSNKPIDAVLPSAAAQELLHLAMLVHDDIIDRDTVRYGVKNITGQFMDHYQELANNTVDQRHFSESAAMLAGDLLISEAYLLIGQTDTAPEVILEVQRLLASAVFHVVGGELLDTEAAFRGKDSADPLVIATEKTASYSFITPFLTGATLAGTSAEQLDLLQQLGEKLGIAYQLRDDIIGVFGDQAITGKSSDGDIREGKRTMLIDEFYKRTDAHDDYSDKSREKFDQLFGKPDASSDDIGTIRTLLTGSGAVDAIEARIASYHTEVLSQLDALKLSAEHHQTFITLFDFCLKRES